ncbi:hypothetical protein [Rhizorhabdus argentea]|uniref:hypothetical protein n=1 Tax=Rhizorhabdus argentea TaxID=1387174 RepID=UPI0030EDB848
MTAASIVWFRQDLRIGDQTAADCPRLIVGHGEARAKALATSAPLRKKLAD